MHLINLIIMHILSFSIEFLNVYFYLVASLLSCLHELRAENIRLEKEVRDLTSRRDNLLAINSRLKVLPSSENSMSGGVPLSALTLFPSKSMPPSESHVPATATFTGFMPFDSSVVHSTQVTFLHNPLC